MVKKINNLRFPSSVLHCCSPLFFAKLVWNPDSLDPWFFLCVLPQGTKKEGNIAEKRYLQYEANSSAMVADSFTDWLTD